MEKQGSGLSDVAMRPLRGDTLLHCDQGSAILCVSLVTLWSSLLLSKRDILPTNLCQRWPFPKTKTDENCIAW